MGTLEDLLDAGEKLITEHASAAVLRDHLALVNAQIKASDEEHVDLKNRGALPMPTVHQSESLRRLE